jgi:hypothetical protein
MTSWTYLEALLLLVPYQPKAVLQAPGFGVSVHNKVLAMR